jgi:hypothetical protein
LKGDEYKITSKPIKKDDVENKVAINSLDSSYSNEVQEHLSK